MALKGLIRPLRAQGASPLAVLESLGLWPFPWPFPGLPGTASNSEINIARSNEPYYESFLFVQKGERLKKRKTRKNVKIGNSSITL